MLARLVKVILDSVPGPVVDKLRTLPVVAPLLRRLLGAFSRPLHGTSMAINRGPAQGLLMRFDETSAVWTSGTTEMDVQTTLARLVRPGSVFFDIGANVGFFTLLGARLVGPSGTVVAFEPHPENVEKLRHNVELNGFANVLVDPRAVSDTSGERLLDAAHSAKASLVPAGGPRGAGTVVGVEATSLDDYVRLRPDLAPDVVKIDAEGHEVEIVGGMQSTLGRSRPVLVCEMHRRTREFIEAAHRAGYMTRSLDGRPADESSQLLRHILAVPAGRRVPAAPSGPR